MIRIIVADDQSLIRQAVATMLGLETDIEVVAQTGDCTETVLAVAEYAPDVVLLDVQMPGGEDGYADGIDIISPLKEKSPNTKVLIVTTFGRPGYLRRAMESGAHGFMVKDAPAERIADSIRQIAGGAKVVDPELAAASLSVGVSPLTAKETEVLTLASGGASTAELGMKLFLSEGTVRNYLSNILAKLGARNRAEAVRIANDNGWL